MLEEEETEIKFYVHNFDELRKKVEKITPEMKHFTRAHEKNLRFDDQHGLLKKKDQVLRLRRWGNENTLTFKDPKIKSKFKKRPELEIKIDKRMHTLQEAKKILEKLGFHQYMEYEKWREKFKFRFDDSELEVCFDEMPYGNFVEIEGSEKDILEVTQRLGFEWKNSIDEDYITIFEDLCKEKNLDFSDLTFKNFEKVDPKILDFESFIRRYYQCMRRA